MKNIIAILSILIIIVNCRNPVEPELNARFRNGDFEDGENKPENWEIWTPNANGYTWSLDDKVFYSGKRSLKSKRSPGYTLVGKYTFFRQLITDFRGGNEIIFSAFVRTSTIFYGTAALAIKFLDNNDNILDLQATDKFITGSKSWKRYFVESFIPENTKKIYVYCIHDGDGQAWFDSASVFLE
ncbi:hypothetical protein ACFL4T_01170 [candidate division KSB1 bacterium]